MSGNDPNAPWGAPPAAGQAPQQPAWGAPPQAPPPEGWQQPAQAPPEGWQQPPQGAPQGWQQPQQAPPQGWQQPGGGAAPASDIVTPPTNPNPVLYAVASFFFPGLGQLLAGQQTKGIVLLAVSFFTGAMCGLLCIVGAIDAYLIGKKFENGTPVRQWDFF